MKDYVTVINDTHKEIKSSQTVFVKTKKLYVLAGNMYKKYKWYRRLIFKKPIEVGFVRGVDTSRFCEGKKLFLASNGTELIQLK